MSRDRSPEVRHAPLSASVRRTMEREARAAIADGDATPEAYRQVGDEATDAGAPANKEGEDYDAACALCGRAQGSLTLRSDVGWVCMNLAACRTRLAEALEREKGHTLSAVKDRIELRKGLREARAELRDTRAELERADRRADRYEEEARAALSRADLAETALALLDDAFPNDVEHAKQRARREATDRFERICERCEGGYCPQHGPSGVVAARSSPT